MGCDAWGLAISDGETRFDALKSHPVLIGSDDWTSRVHESICGKFLIVEGEFFTFVLALESRTLSLYKATIRDAQTWSEETPIYKAETTHLQGENGKHYYLQYPFVPDEEFWHVFRAYEVLRVSQIRCAKEA